MRPCLSRARAIVSQHRAACSSTLSGSGAEGALNTGVVPPTRSKLEQDLLQAVLDGQCPDTASIRSFPARVAVALSPHAFHTTSETGFNGQHEAESRIDHDRFSG